jgi:hypothetical protein
MDSLRQVVFSFIKLLDMREISTLFPAVGYILGDPKIGYLDL